MWRRGRGGKGFSGKNGLIIYIYVYIFLIFFFLQISLMLNYNVVGRAVFFYCVVIYLMFALMENGWLPIFSSAFHRLQNALG